MSPPPNPPSLLLRLTLLSAIFSAALSVSTTLKSSGQANLKAFAPLFSNINSNSHSPGNHLCNQQHGLYSQFLHKLKRENFDSHGFGIEKIWLKAPHQYTQGFRYLGNGDILESTGIFGHSHLQYLRPDTCGTGFHIVRSNRESLKPSMFGEGADVIQMGPKEKYVFQLTWKNRRIFIYKARDLRLFRTIWMPKKIGQGWGLTSNPETRQIYVTNGTSSVFLCQASLTKDAEGLSKVKFRCDNGNPVKISGSQTGPNNLNEFEYKDNNLYTNEYMTDNIHKINAENFSVSHTWDMAALRAFTNKLLAKENSNALHRDEVLNGITWNTQAG